MSTYYYLRATEAREAVPLGKKVNNSLGYEGPVVWISGSRYRLPEKYLSILLKRFRDCHGADNTVFCGDYELFDSGELIPEEEDVFIIGGDRDKDPPIEKYLPEITDPHVMAEIAADQGLKI